MAFGAGAVHNISFLADYHHHGLGVITRAAQAASTPVLKLLLAFRDPFAGADSSANLQNTDAAAGSDQQFGAQEGEIPNAM